MLRVQDFVFQRNPGECGLASLATVLRSKRVNVTLDELLLQWKCSPRGSPAATLVTAAKSHSFEAAAFELDPDSLRAVVKPAILFWRQSHYVVLGRCTNDTVSIFDPAHGAYVAPWAELEKRFGRVAVLVWRRGSFPFRRDGGCRETVTEASRRSGLRRGSKLPRGMQAHLAKQEQPE